MDGRRALRLTILGAGAAAAAGILALPRLVGGSPDPLLTLAFAAAFLALAAAGLAWAAVERLLLAPARRLSAAARILAHGGGEGALEPAGFGALNELAGDVAGLAGRIASAEAEAGARAVEAARRAEEQSGRLAALLRDLHQGVLVCNLRHQVLLYNEAARTLVGPGDGLGLGRSLLDLVTAAPVRHTLDRLGRRIRDGRHRAHVDGIAAGFVTAAADGRLLQCRMAAILDAAEEVTGYVVTFEDATKELASLARRDALLRAATDEARGPIAALSAAAEMLAAHPELTAEERAPFDAVVVTETERLVRTLERITEDYRAGIASAWPMNDVHSGNLFALVAERRRAAGGGPAPDLTPVGLPCWLHGDSYSLVLLLSHLACRAGHAAGAARLDVSAEAEAAGRFVYVDLAWEGAPLPADTVASWRDDRLEGALAGLSLGDILDHHGADLWSEAVPGETPRARLRLPLPPAQAVHGRPGDADPPAPRPEFFDFDLLHQPLPEGALGRTPLRRLSFVVFDTETTGLSPSQGDEIVSIAGVRIVNGRILTGESFHSLVDPGRPIPEPSVRIHGITDAMVAGQPRIGPVLKRFRDFVGTSVLVAHNAAFDLKFLKMKQAAAGVRFDVPVLDTMILSRQIQGEDGDHSLDGIAARLGIRVTDRHSALGDALVTAAILLRFVELLAERGTVTLDEAIRHSNMAVELHARERAF